MTMLIGFIQARVKYAALLAAAVFFLVSSGALGVVLLTTKWDLHKARGDLVQSHKDTAEANRLRGVCESGQTQLRAELTAQNAAVRQLKEEADAADAEGRRKLAEAAKVAQTYKTRAEALSRAKPSDPSNLCVSAQKLITDTLSSERGQ